MSSTVTSPFTNPPLGGTVVNMSCGFTDTLLWLPEVTEAASNQIDICDVINDTTTRHQSVILRFVMS